MRSGRWRRMVEAHLRSPQDQRFLAVDFNIAFWQYLSKSKRDYKDFDPISEQLMGGYRAYE